MEILMNVSPFLRRAFLVLMIAATPAILCGCGKMSGKYKDASGLMTLEFKGSKVAVTIGGTTSEVDYTVDGDKITVHGPNGTAYDFTRSSDGSLSGGQGMKLTKE